MQRKKLAKLQKHLRTLKLFKVKCWNMSLPRKNDKTRFAMADYQFECGGPACVAGHAEYLFNWRLDYGFYDKFQDFFGLNEEETDWITDSGSYKSKNPRVETAVKHIQDVLDGKFG